MSKACLVARVENWSLASLSGGSSMQMLMIVDGWFQNVEAYKGLTCSTLKPIKRIQKKHLLDPAMHI